MIRDLSPGRTENIVAVEDKYLVSPMASSAVADRLANYHSHKETISAPAVYLDELPGNRVYAAHPYDKVDLGACLTTADITLSVHLAAQMDLLAGYVPLVDDEYYDTVELITQDGVWTPPPGTTSVTAVLVGGGGGGDGGGYGTDGQRGSGSGPGTGGLAGKAGAAGKIYRLAIEIKAGDTFAVHLGAAGVGGKGGVNGYSGAATAAPTAGTAGGDTTFGVYSSASGSATESGWLDQVSGQRFGRPGADGADGADGGKSGKKGGDVTWAGTTYTGGNAGVSGSSGGGGGGGGAAAGKNGWPGAKPVGNTYDGGQGGYGANAALDGADGLSYGDAGSGGHGGGGGGQGGTGKISGLGGHGGDGTKGGNGKPGCVLLYYRKPKQTVSGWGVTSKGQWRLDKYGRRCIV